MGREASSASTEEAKLFRERLSSNPHDLASRLFLLARARPSSDTYAKHLSWLIENHPRHIAHDFISPSAEHPAYEACKPLWHNQVGRHRNDVTVLLHAAEFFGSTSPETSVRLLQKAALVDPSDDEIPRSLAFVYRLMAGHYSIRKNRFLAKKSVEQMQIAIDRYSTPAEQDSYLLSYFAMELLDAANTALSFDLTDEAKSLGQIMMSHREINARRLAHLGDKHSSLVYRVSTYLGHVVLGKAAIAAGDIESAKGHLLSMIGEPVAVWRLDFELAHLLHEVGATDCV